MPEVDAALVVFVVGRHVVGPDQVVEAAAGPPHGRDHIVSGPQLGHVVANRLDPAEVLVPGHEKRTSFRRLPVFPGVDLLVRAVHSAPQQTHQHPSTSRDVREGGFGELGQVGAVRFAGIDRDGFHHGLPSLVMLRGKPLPAVLPLESRPGGFVTAAGTACI